MVRVSLLEGARDRRCVSEGGNPSTDSGKPKKKLKNS